MDEQRQKAFDFCSDLTKQLLTLSTGIIAISVTFSKDVFSTPSAGSTNLVIASWVCYVVSIFFGIWTLMALTGTLEPQSAGASSVASIRGLNVRIPSLLQIVLFLFGIVCTVAFAVNAAGVRKLPAHPQEFLVPSVVQAVELVMKTLPDGAKMKLNQAQLVNGVETPHSRNAVWRIEIEVTPRQPMPASKAEKRTRPNPSPGPVLHFNYFVDAQTGTIVHWETTVP